MPEARSITIRLPLPDSPNRTNRGMTKGARIAIAKEKARLREDARKVALDIANRRGWKTSRLARLGVHFELAHTKHDWDNLIAAVKPLIDGIVDAKVISDDRLNIVRQFVPTYSNGGKNEVIFYVTDLAEG